MSAVMEPESLTDKVMDCLGFAGQEQLFEDYGEGWEEALREFIMAHPDISTPEELAEVYTDERVTRDDLALPHVYESLKGTNG